MPRYAALILATSVMVALLIIPQPLVLSAVDFEADIYGGGTFRLSDFKGKVVVIVIAQTSCPHCKEFLPALSRAWKSDSELMSGKYVLAVVMLDPLHPFSAKGVSEDKKAFDSFSPPSGWILLPEAWHSINVFGIKYTASVVIVDKQGNVVEKIEPQDHPKIDEMVSYTIMKVKERGAEAKVLRFSFSAPRIAFVGDTVTLQGEVQPATVGVNVTIIKPGGEEIDVKPRVIGNGQFSMDFTPDLEGVWIVRASSLSETREVRITVLPNKPRGIESYDVIYGTHDERAGKIINQNAKRSKSLPKDNVVLLGGPKANPLVPEFNSIAGISMILDKEAKLFIGSKEYDLRVSFGKEDYAVVYWLRWEGRFIIVGEGFTRFGTLAASLFMKNTQLEKQLYLIHWKDLNGDGDVSYDEIEVLMTIEKI